MVRKSVREYKIEKGRKTVSVLADIQRPSRPLHFCFVVTEKMFVLISSFCKSRRN